MFNPPSPKSIYKPRPQIRRQIRRFQRSNNKHNTRILYTKVQTQRLLQRWFKMSFTTALQMRAWRRMQPRLSVGLWADGPLRQSCASITRERRNRSWELMYWAEERSPVQRVMSMQSRDWLRRSRRVERGARRSGWVRFMARWRGRLWRS